MRMVIHDVGHGQAVHIFTPAGQTIVIDLGCSEGFSPLEWLKGQTSTIDSLIITHPHGDHIDEFLLLKKHGFKITQFLRTKWLSKEDVYKANQASMREKLDAYFAMSESYNVPITQDKRVGNPEVSGGVSVENFYTDACGVSNINNHSFVSVISHAGSSIMIPGDNEPPSWRKLLENPKFVSALKKTDIFMASHHGRESGYCAELFEVKPKLCVISDGRVKETDVTSRYSCHAQGWEVHYRDKSKSASRNCVTTRSDGHIDIKTGKNPSGHPYLSVTVD